MRPAFLFLALLLLSQVARAQLYAYHVSGTVLRKAGAASQPLHPRDAVGPGQTLVLARGAQVVLIDQQGRNISYTRPGTVPYAALQKAFQDSQTSTGRAYLAYVWQSLNHHAPTQGHLANAPIGGVARGDAPPLLAPADSAVLEQPVTEFRWQGGAAAPVWFTLTDATGDPLLQLSAAAPALELNTLLTRLKRNTVYYWQVSATPESAANAPRRAFVIADAEGLRQFAQELSGLPAGANAESWQRGYRAHWFFARAARR
jgi:hypothetical protein